MTATFIGDVSRWVARAASVSEYVRAKGEPAQERPTLLVGSLAGYGVSGRIARGSCWEQALHRCSEVGVGRVDRSVRRAHVGNQSLDSVASWCVALDKLALQRTGLQLVFGDNCLNRLLPNDLALA